MDKIKVLCVDDSALIRSVLTEIIDSQPDMEVVCTAANPLLARELIKSMRPDVLTLDIKMPHMDGLDFLERLMRLRPIPVVMVSSLTAEGSETALRALELGAVDFIDKPRFEIRDGLLQYTELITSKIRGAAGARLKRAKQRRSVKLMDLSPPTPIVHSPLQSSEKLIVIGASTGGTEAIREVLMHLPADSPPVLIAQHMPAGFTTSFAHRLDQLCQVTVKEAEHGECLLQGHAYIAPGDFHLSLVRRGGTFLAQVGQQPPVNRHRPSIDVLFESVAQHAGKNAIGMILTGMGKDGAAGLLKMKQAGAYTLAQDESSCVVFGMPREAIALGAVDDVASLENISSRVLSHLRACGGRTSRSINQMEKS